LKNVFSALLDGFQKSLIESHRILPSVYSLRYFASRVYSDFSDPPPRIDIPIPSRSFPSLRVSPSLFFPPKSSCVFFASEGTIVSSRIAIAHAHPPFPPSSGYAKVSSFSSAPFVHRVQISTISMAHFFFFFDVRISPREMTVQWIAFPRCSLNTSSSFCLLTLFGRRPIRRFLGLFRLPAIIL